MLYFEKKSRNLNENYIQLDEIEFILKKILLNMIKQITVNILLDQNHEAKS